MLATGLPAFFRIPRQFWARILSTKTRSILRQSAAAGTRRIQLRHAGSADASPHHRYRFQGILMHEGSASAGHYFVRVRHSFRQLLICTT